MFMSVRAPASYAMVTRMASLKRLRSSVVITCLIFQGAAFAAQDFYKDKTIRFIVEQAAGGG